MNQSLKHIIFRKEKKGKNLKFRISQRKFHQWPFSIWSQCSVDYISYILVFLELGHSFISVSQVELIFPLILP